MFAGSMNVVSSPVSDLDTLPSLHGTTEPPHRQSDVDRAASVPMARVWLVGIHRRCKGLARGPYHVKGWSELDYVYESFNQDIQRK